jgi:outer membrane protein OmpA-like peptidoglycan-associated protein
MNYFKYASTLLLVSSSLAFAADVADSSQDKIEYRATPVAEQQFDLKDDDDDGVINARDLCPGTPIQSRIDNDGCGTYTNNAEEKQLHILFSNASSEINPIFASQISEMASFLKEFPTTSIELSGYASKVGKPDLNLTLSKDRALAVQNQLISDGIESDRIKIVAYGDTKLEAEGDDPISHAKNRRVVASVVGHKGEISKRWTIFTTLPRQMEY